MTVRRSRSAPLPLVGRGWGWGSIGGSPHDPHPGASLAADGARAARDHVDALAARDIARAGVELDQTCLAAPLGEYAEQLLGDAGCAFDRHPLVVRRIHEDRLRIARLGIDHGPLIHMFPDRLVAVEIALALDIGAAAKDAVLELALFSELAHSGLHLGL